MSAHNLIRRLMLRAFRSRPSISIRKLSRPLGRLEILEDRWVPTVGPNVNITRSAGAGEAETTISVNPTNTLQLFEIDTYTDVGHYSTDGGATWKPSNLAGFTDHLGDTQTAWDRFGNLFLTQFGANQVVEVGVSTDGGASFASVLTVPNSSVGDQHSIAGDPSGTVAPG